MLTRDDLLAVCPRPKDGARRAIWDGYADAMTSVEGTRLFRMFDVTTRDRLAMFLGAVVAPETGMTVLWESGAYSADGIMRVYGGARHSAKVTRAEAERIAALPVEARTRELFERVYGLGNPVKARELGNTQSGDGWRFRGLGLNQMTGRAAHEAAAAEIGCACDALASPINCLHMALIEWDEKDCNRWADAGDVVAVRKLINGGSLNVSASRINGLPEAQQAYRRALAAISPADAETPPAASAGAASDRPATLMHSTEVQMAGAAGGGGAMTASQGVQNAVVKTASTGAWSWRMFLLHLLSDPLFLSGVVTVGAAAYWFLKRRYNYHVRGI